MNLSNHQFTSRERQILDLYKGNSPHLEVMCFADHINRSLRQANPLDGEWGNAVEVLDSLIASAEPTEECTLHRATVDDYVTPYLDGSIYTYPAFMSTSSEPNAVQRHFATRSRERPAAFLKINCPNGAKTLNMEINQAFGGLEYEVLLPRNSRFLIESVCVVEDRNKMNQIMSPLYAKNYTELKIYTLLYLGGA